MGYFNYKKSFSIVLLALVDYRYHFTFVDIGSNGSNSDSGIFRNSSLYRKIQNKTLAIPDEKPLTTDDQPCPHVIVGDEAFLIARNPPRLSEKFALGAMSAVDRANTNLFAFAFAFAFASYFKGPSIK